MTQKPKLVTLCVKLVKIGAQPVARGLNLRPLQLFRIADEAPRRGAQPEDMGRAAVYLASDQAAMITGTCLPVDGGRCI